MNGESRAVRIVADLMALSARTAPKAKGDDTLVIRVAVGGELLALAEEMRTISEQKQIRFFARDADNVTISDACLLVGTHGEVTAGVNCGGCGFPTCREMLDAFEKRESTPDQGPFIAPSCLLRVTDLGIAIGSAVKTASIHNVDNRVMYSAGVAALSLGWLEDCTAAFGVPVSVSGKSPYFDRQRR